MNTPQQQAELYRKAAETIEMCAPHGIEPMVKICGVALKLDEIRIIHNIESYEFPLAVIEGQLVWVGDIVYDSYGRSVKVEAVEYWQGDSEISIKTDGRWYLLSKYTLIPPKQPLCEVEGKPVYKGDNLWFIGNENVKAREIIAKSVELFCGFDCLYVEDGGMIEFKYLSLNPPKRTVMIELIVEDAESIANYWDGSWIHNDIAQRTTTAIRKALDNLK